MFTPGDAFATVELDGLRIGILICYDVEFPEAVARWPWPAPVWSRCRPP